MTATWTVTAPYSGQAIQLQVVATNFLEGPNEWQVQTFGFANATLTELTANIGGRTVRANAQRKQKARETYEQALDGGKTAVLHEELLKGVHMLSVGHVPPGADVEVVSVWTAALEADGQSARVRIPTTVGEVYGRSPLSDSDTLTHAAFVHRAELAVSSDSGVPHLLGGQLADGRASISLDAPVVIAVTGWTPRPLVGTTADGRQVRLSVAPVPDVERPISVRVLVDVSGSMSDAAQGGRGPTRRRCSAW